MKKEDLIKCCIDRNLDSNGIVPDLRKRIINDEISKRPKGAEISKRPKNMSKKGTVLGRLETIQSTLGRIEDNLKSLISNLEL
jgi:hypothetical protein